MKLKNFGRAALALAASAVTVLGMTSCSLSYTVGYLYITGSTPNGGPSSSGQIASYRIQNNNGFLRNSSTTGSGGTNPTQVVVNSTGNYLYVLNKGTGTSSAPAISSIALFSIGGVGAPTYQASFNPQGLNTKNIVVAGNYLYALDEFAPGGKSYGDVSVFSIDGATGRLTAVLNNQQRDSNGLPLTYFPVGTNPTWMAVNGSYAYIAEQGPTGGVFNPQDPPQAVFIYNQSATTGQLTLTQNTPTPTGATQLTYVYASSQYLYLLDAGPAGSTGSILPYTPGSGGALTAVTGGARLNNGQGQSPVGPTALITSNFGAHAFVWVANSGINTSGAAVGNVIGAYVVQTDGKLADANTGSSTQGLTSGTGTRCLVVDPSNQYLYAVNFNDSTITGKKINTTTGGLDKLPKPMPTPPGSPTWCATTGSHF